MRAVHLEPGGSQMVHCRLRHASLLLAACIALLVPALVLAQPGETASTVVAGLQQALRFRHIGPFRGGRSTAVTGVPSEPFTFYVGSTGGGVFKTTDAGVSWKNVSDGYFAAGSIGAVAVAPADPNIVYVGTGSACPRGNVSPGIGMYKSSDAGATWQHIGLADAGQIAKLAVHPVNSEVVYAAVLGHVFGPNEQRGVFRSGDGGRSWDRVLYVDAETGAVDIKMDPKDPQVIYAAFWRAERKPWTIISGGPQGGIYKSIDGGDSWKKLSAGLPQGLTGRIGIAVSPANARRVWAIIEGERIASGFERDETGMYRSDDAGETWQHLTADPELHQRPWYYHHLVADPHDDQVLYHIGDSLWKSTDGGVNFKAIAVPHVDQHDLWINPNDPRIMIEASDGGGAVTLNSGATWSSLLNQPTAELYEIGVDEAFPYRVYAGQQDYSTISLPSRVFAAGGITLQHWRTAGGGEMGPVAVDPEDADVAYAGGYLSRMDRTTGQIRRVMDYPQYWSGVPASKLKYRVSSLAPVLTSIHDPGIVYAASQYVHRSRNGGETWELISPDLTRNDPDHIVPSGGPLTHDITSVETYCTIVALTESPLARGVLWAGSDDGLVHLTRNGGKTWSDVTPSGMPEGRVNRIDASAQAPGRALIAVDRHFFDDFHPYIYSTDDYGAHWRLISAGNGIPEDHFVHAVREDPDRRGLLYAGSEFGLYASFDDGIRWQPFQLNLPITPISDVVIHHQDLIVSTQGRGFWILDDVTPLHQLDTLDPDRPYLFKPRDAYRVEGTSQKPGPYISQDELLGANIESDRIGENPPPGAMIFYYLPGAATQERQVRLHILDGDGREIRSYAAAKADAGEATVEAVKTEAETEAETEEVETEAAEDELAVAPGMNRFVWDLSYPGADVIAGSRLDGYTGGPRAVPGLYQARLEVGDWSETQSFAVLQDPRSKSTLSDLRRQFDFLVQVRDKLTQTHTAVRRIQAIRAEVDAASVAAPAADSPTEHDARRARLAELARSIDAELDGIEDQLRQKRAKVWQDTANFEPLLDDQFAWLASYTLSADTRPTDSAYQRYEDLSKELAAILARLDRLEREDLPALRSLLAQREDL